MKSAIIRVRLQPHELAMLSTIQQSRDQGERNVSEIVRLLIHREYERRTTGRSVVPGNAIASDFRTGRPRVNG